MSERRYARLNQLEHDLPEGLIVDAAWMAANGYSTALRAKYVESHRLEQPARSVYRRPRGTLGWQQVVISLQTLLGRSLAVGGRTALEVMGFAHFVSPALREVHLYGASKPPGWLEKLKLDVSFHFHNARPLFPEKPEPPFTPLDGQDAAGDHWSVDDGIHFMVTPWGQWGWPMTMSSPERALLELLNELPTHETFHQVDELIDGLVSLRPGHMKRLLAGCASVKVKRLLFFFMDRHPHAWTKRLTAADFDLGHGKRMLQPGGRLDKRYLITVPEDLSGVQ